MYSDALLYVRCRHIPLLQWFNCWGGGFYNLGVQTLLAVDCSARGQKVKISRIPYAGSWSGLFVARGFGKKELLEFYYGSFLYADLPGSGIWRKHIKKELCSWLRRCFKVLEQATEKFKSWEEVDRRLWIVLAQFCTVPYLNYAMYLPGDDNPNSERWQNRGSNNFKLLPNKSSSSPKKFCYSRTFSIHTSRNTSVQKELLVHFRNKYDSGNRERTQ